MTTIGDNLFQYCENLTNVTIGKNVTDIKSYAFYGCYNLTNIYCKAINPPTMYDDSVLSNDVTDRKIYVPTASVEAYKSSPYWEEYADSIVGYDF